MKITHTLIKFIKWFLYITPCIIFICAVHTTISKDVLLPASMLWQIMLSGFLTAFVTVLFLPENHKHLTISADYLLHYITLSIVMIGCGCSFEWIEFNTEGILMMLISVAIVYLLVFTVHYLIDIKQAEEINQKLKEKYGDK